MSSPLVLFFKKGFIALGVVCVFVFGFVYLQNTKKEVVAKAPIEQIWTVAAVIAQSGTAQPVDVAFGTVRSGREAQLRFGVGGEVVMVADRLRNGVDVEKGEILARLDNERFMLALEDTKVQIESENRQIKQLTTQLEVRERMYARAVGLFKQSVGAQADVDAAELAVSVAASQLDMAKSRLDQLLIAKRRHEKDIEDSVLKAPFDGTVSEVQLALGNQVSSAHLVGHLTDLSQLEISFVVPVNVYHNVARLIGQKVTVDWTSAGSKAVSMPAVITRSEVIVDKAEGGGRLYAELPADAARTIPPGAFVEIHYNGQSFEDVFALPEAALVSNDYVYVIIDGRAQERKVVVVHRNPGTIWVRGDLTSGESVIATRLPGIGNGMRVRLAQNS